MDSLPITLPADQAPQKRAPVPFLAAIVPVAAGIVLWSVTGSVLALCFAALGPLMIVASLLDAARLRRRERRQGVQRTEEGWASAEEELTRRHEEERRTLWQRHPDTATCIAQPPLRGTQPVDEKTWVVVGAGQAASEVRCNGGDDARARAFRERCRVVTGSPLVVPLGGGICLRGAGPLTAAAARALILQLCLRFGPAQFSLVGGEGLDADLVAHGLGALPHGRRVRRRGFRVAMGSSAGARSDADALICTAGLGEDVPEGVTSVIDIVEPGLATLRTASGTTEIAVEFLSSAQAEMLAREIAQRSDEDGVLPDSVALRSLEQPDDAIGLAAAIGCDERGSAAVDIVGDGPHALVTGMTGTGKSELLVSWVTAIASVYGPDRVTFVLADFKGGTAFEPLRALPQVVAVITDLDEGGARRGVSSLTAELRRREAVLAAAGARDARDISMPRLVIVVDEFAALLAEHADLGAVFTDIAARGRALGMHLILGTQRAAGVVRDALAANCPLRISLRVSDAADSRLMVGSDAAALLPGDPGSRGIALVRRPTDQEPVALRVALTDASDLRDVGMRWAAADRPPSPWLPPLPPLLPLSELLGEQAASAVAGSDAGPDTVVIGRADDPGRQTQPPVLLQCGKERGIAVLGTSGSGRTAVLRAVAAQRGDAFWMPSDPEEAWDLLAGWADGGERPPSIVLCDDVDALLAGVPPEYAHQLVQRWEQVLRAAQGTTFVMTATRAGGVCGRVLDVLPRRALLRMPTKLEHLAAGGEPSGFLRDRAPGRARIGEHEVQLAWADESESPRFAQTPPETWRPTFGLTAIVTAGTQEVIARLRHAHPEREVTDPGAERVEASGSCIVVGDAEEWQRNWTLWQRVRSAGEVLIRCERPADLRQLIGARDLPPYARPNAGRAWSVIGAESPRRVHLTELLPR
ncbi:ESX-1 secretion system protein EccCa1 [Microbacterium oxydans]|uniref:ESX-1 secretion system protein EccCa1 n=1 Tax=Microbacterium oxydans TaxID=82380 RepID=A0A0F0KGI4_9MICO|nr:FtsK/SpoIIIE domain-containing protein [Microbacterium oxydans]KJL18391.1 ESX-1 secretion system protein EccCa1 [Microbacterium oxydans]